MRKQAGLVVAGGLTSLAILLAGCGEDESRTTAKVSSQPAKYAEPGQPPSHPPATGSGRSGGESSLYGFASEEVGSVVVRTADGEVDAALAPIPPRALRQAGGRAPMSAFVAYLPVGDLPEQATAQAYDDDGQPLGSADWAFFDS